MTPDDPQLRLIQAAFQSALDASTATLKVELRSLGEKLDDHKETIERDIRHEKANREAADRQLQGLIEKKADAEVMAEWKRGIEKSIDGKVDSSTFQPVRLIAFGVVALMLAAVIGALLKLVLIG